VSEACQNCYAKVMARRLQGNHIKSYEEGFKVTRNMDAIREPYGWKKSSMVFVVSMGDLFHDDVPDTWLNPVMRVIEKTPQHTYQLLTKRPWNMDEYFLRHPVPKNVWLGTTCENSRHYDRIDALRGIRCNNVKFISCEPLLGAMNDINLDGIDWVITGGESGSRARRTPVEWFRGLRDACLRWNTPFFFKQWGAWGEDGVKRSKYLNGSLLDGVEWRQWPSKNQ
jgi:protein gp37